MKNIKIYLTLIALIVILSKIEVLCAQGVVSQSEFVRNVNSAWQSKDYEGLKVIVEQQIASQPDDPLALAFAMYYYLYVEDDSAKANSTANQFVSAVSAEGSIGQKAIARELKNDIIQLSNNEFWADERSEALLSSAFPNIALCVLFVGLDSTPAIPIQDNLSEYLRITEIMYNPPDPRTGTSEQSWNTDDFEYLELCNIGTEALDLYGVTIEGGVSFSFSEGSSQMLIPGDCMLIVTSIDAFKTRYGVSFSADIVGEYAGTLADTGEQIIIKNASGTTVLDLTYDDDWYPSTNGGGHSLELVNPGGDMSSQSSWRESENDYGSPFFTHIEAPLREYLRITEIMYHPVDSDDYEFIELKNIGSETLDLSDVSFAAGISFQFNGSNVTSLDAGQYVLVVKNEDAFKTRYDDNNNRYSRIAGEYAGDLSNNGEKIILKDSRGILIDFAYDDEWYDLTAGKGKSLTLVNSGTPSSVYGEKTVWRASYDVDGSPAESDQPSLIEVTLDVHRNIGEDRFRINITFPTGTNNSDAVITPPPYIVFLEKNVKFDGEDPVLLSDNSTLTLYFNVVDVVAQLEEGQRTVILRVEGTLVNGISFSGVSEQIDTSIFLNNSEIPWAPIPNPLTWSKLPTLVRPNQNEFLFDAEMTATIAVNPITESSTQSKIEYLFDCKYEDQDAYNYDSDWQESSDYTVSIGGARRKLFFRVKARNANGVETEWSEFEELKDRTPPTPNPMMWEGDSMETAIPPQFPLNARIEVGEGEPRWILVDPSLGEGGEDGWAITMSVSAENFDDSGYIEYNFVCSNYNIHLNYGHPYWTTETSITTKPIPANKRWDAEENWGVQARDKEGNMTQFSWPVRPWGRNEDPHSWNLWMREQWLGGDFRNSPGLDP